MRSTIPKAVGITSFRRRMSKYLKDAQHEPVVLVERSNHQYIVLDITLYNNLIEGRIKKEDRVAHKKREFLDRLKEYGPFTLRVKKTSLKPALQW